MQEMEFGTSWVLQAAEKCPIRFIVIVELPRLPIAEPNCCSLRLSFISRHPIRVEKGAQGFVSSYQTLRSVNASSIRRPESPLLVYDA